MTMTATLSPRPTRVVAWSRLGDELLAGRAAGGNDAAFTALYERYYGPLLGYTRSILLDAEDARDATQNALEKALRALPTRVSDQPLRPWLYKIAHNEAINIMRRRRPQTELVAAFEPTVPGPEVDAEQRGRLEQLVDDLRSLPERQRGALVMRELNGLSYDEIGAALGLTVDAARRAVFDARTALHDAADGRATACFSVRHSISDGDRRSLRARGIRAHLRSCDDCASFQRSIGARRADLHMLAPWVSGAAIIGTLGLGAGGGGGALLASGAGAGASAGGGIGWASLPLAVKGLAVAAAVAGTGTAAVEIEHVSRPDRPAAKAQAAQTADPRATQNAIRAAALAATTSRAAAPATASARSGERMRTATATVGSRRNSPSRSSTAALLAPPAANAKRAPASPAASAPQTSATAPSASAPAGAAPETAIQRLERLRQQVLQAFTDAQAIAAGGSRDALALAAGMLDRTLGPLVTTINRVLASVGLSLPSSPATAPATSPTTSSVLAPVQQILGGVGDLLQRLLGMR